MEGMEIEQLLVTPIWRDSQMFSRESVYEYFRGWFYLLMEKMRFVFVFSVVFVMEWNDRSCGYVRRGRYCSLGETNSGQQIILAVIVIVKEGAIAKNYVHNRNEFEDWNKKILLIYVLLRKKLAYAV